MRHGTGMANAVDGEVKLGRIHVRPFDDYADIVRRVIVGPGTVAPGFTVAINPEKVVRALGDRELARTVEEATIRYPDGIGVVWAMRRRGVRTARLAGADLWLHLMRGAEAAGVDVFLLGGDPKVIDSTRRQLELQLPRLRIAGTHHGYFPPDGEPAIRNSVAASGAGIVCVAMGSPRQESLISRLRELHPGAFYMGVGGTFDVYVGKVPRAPVWMQRAGLEWLFRLARQPSRIGRQRSLLTFLHLEFTGKL